MQPLVPIPREARAREGACSRPVGQCLRAEPVSAQCAWAEYVRSFVACPATDYPIKEKNRDRSLASHVLHGPDALRSCAARTRIPERAVAATILRLPGNDAHVASVSFGTMVDASSACARLGEGIS